jgi:hypothetical protein
MTDETKPSDSLEKKAHNGARAAEELAEVI